MLMAHARQETWAVYGDSSASFVQRTLFNIGLVARHSLLGVNGGEYWLSENGPYFFDGSAPQYIGEGVRGLLNGQPGSSQPGLSVEVMATATAAYANLTYYLMFPNAPSAPINSQILGYFIPNSAWMGNVNFQPASPAAVSSRAAYPSSFTAGKTAVSFNEVVACGPAGFNQSKLYYMFADNNYDLGQPQTFSWMSPFTRSKNPRDEKQYDYITLDLPPFQYGTATVFLQVDNKPLLTWTIPDLSTNTRFIKALGYNGATVRGYMAQVIIEASGVAGQNAPVIWAVTVWGSVPLQRPLTPRV
jgi:hypothetical protein